MKIKAILISLLALMLVACNNSVENTITQDKPNNEQQNDKQTVVSKKDDFTFTITSDKKYIPKVKK